MLLAKNDIEDVRSELLFKRHNVVERNGALKAMKIYTFMAEI
ncbi:hypothetical protein [Campylobacter concisus]|nr:hypothetical protein [Campylobacter concisus]